MLRNIRNNYSKFELAENQLNDDPLIQFKQWLNEAIEAGSVEPTAMVLSTISVNKYPDSRVVLLKEISEKGFVFYTNLDSTKGRQIRNNPNVCINFFWPEMERQVRIVGVAFKLDDADAVEYFQSRPRDSQIGACVSSQSRKINSRDELETGYKLFKEKYKHKTIPKPHNWGGYVVQTSEIEFWQGRTNRLHDRIKYELTNNKWNKYRLAP